MIKRKKKIFHLIHSLGNGGTENVLLRTLPLMKDIDNVIISMKNSGDLNEEFLNKGIKVRSLYQKHLLDVRSYIELLRIIKKENPDLIISHLFYADLIGRFWLTLLNNIPVIPYLQTTYNHKRFWIPRLFEKTSKCLVKKYLANSNAVKRFYINKFKIKAEIAVIPNGIPLFTDSIKKRNAIKELNLNIDHGCKIIICVANFAVNKGHIFLLRAYKKYLKKNINTKLLLVGDGAERHNIEKYIIENNLENNIIILGRRRDVDKLLKISDLFVLPTFFEGLSNAVMEAMANNVPVITTNIPENIELIDNHINGELVSVGDAEQIYNAIIKILKNRQYSRFLSNNAYSKIKEHYALTKIVQRWEEYIESNTT